MARVGVLLSGCGVMDGAEIHEAVVTLLALDRAGAEIVCMAPDMDQMHVINHVTNKETPGERRNRNNAACEESPGQGMDGLDDMQLGSPCNHRGSDP